MSREPSGATTVIYPPVPPPNTATDLVGDRDAIRAELDIPADTIVILQVGRLEPGKGHAAHLEAAALLSDLPNWKTLFVGGESGTRGKPYKAELERRAAKLGLADRVSFLGERNDTNSFYAAADIYCQPSALPESFGMTFAEAMYSGLPIATTDIGAAREVLSAECGTLVPVGNAAALAQALRSLISSETERSRLGRAGPERAKMLCDPAECVAKLHETLSRQLR